MSGVVRKLIIFAGVEGLVLQPLVQKEKRGAASPVRISYKDNTIGPALKDEVEKDAPTTSFEAFGIVGTFLVESELRCCAVERVPNSYTMERAGEKETCSPNWGRCKSYMLIGSHRTPDFR